MEDPDAQYLLGSALIELGNVREAVPWLQRFVGSNPTNSYVASARQELADALYREGRLAEAIAQQEIVVSSNPNHASGRLNLATLKPSLSGREFTRGLAPGPTVVLDVEALFANGRFTVDEH